MTSCSESVGTDLSLAWWGRSSSETEGTRLRHEDALNSVMGGYILVLFSMKTPTNDTKKSKKHMLILQIPRLNSVGDHICAGLKGSNL